MYRILVDQIVFVVPSTVKVCALVCQITLVLLLDVDQNVLVARSALRKRRVLIKNALTRVLDIVD